MRLIQHAACVATLGLLGLTSAVTVRAQEVKVAIQFGLAYLPIMMMKEDGLLQAEAKKRGIDDVELTVVKVSGSTAVNEALLSNNVTMGVMGTPSLLLMWDKTRSRLGVKGLASMSSFPMILNTTKTSMSSLRDFAPQDRIAVTATTSPQAMILRMAAEQQFGEGQFKRLDTNTVSLPHPEAMAAMLSKTEVVAHFTNIPYSALEAQNAGVKRLLSSHEVLGEKATFVQLVTTSKFVEDNPKLAEATVAAVAQATERIAADPERAAQVYMKNEPSKLPVSFYVELIKDPENAFSPVPTGIAKYADFMSRTGQLKTLPGSWKDVYFAYMHSSEGN